MGVRSTSRVPWVVFLGAVIAIGILSRVLRTGLVLWDKYLGDALYAVMVYAILRLLLLRPPAVAVLSVVLLTFIELFQLTMIPARLMASEHLVVRICARLLDTEFSFLDLLASGAGIGCVYLVDKDTGFRNRFEARTAGDKKGQPAGF